MSTPTYNLDDTAQPLTISFAPLSIPLVATFVHWDDTNFWPETKPILGVLVQHTVNSAGEVTGDRLNMAIQMEDTGELCTTTEYVLYSSRSSLVAVHAPDSPPSPEEIQRIASFGYRMEQALDARRNQKRTAA